MLRSIGLFLVALLPGCTYFTGDPHVVVTSTPAGAQILLDGSPTGKTTPSRLELGGIMGSDHKITLRKEGYDDEVRHVYHYTTGYTSRWIDGANDITLWPFPIDWTMGDFVLPFGVKWRYVPHEIHAVLYAEGEGPVHASELPAEER